MNYRETILEHYHSTQDNLLIEAVAGSGKTTLLIDIAKEFPSLKTLVVAFNKNIAEDFKTRFPSNCTCSTIHALGFQYLRLSSNRLKVNEKKVENLFRYKILQFNNGEFPHPDFRERFNLFHKPACRIISYLKGMGVTTYKDVPALLPTVYATLKIDQEDYLGQIVPQLYDLSLRQTTVIDFDDMILFPAIFYQSLPKYQLVLVDEAQDMNRCQREFIKKILNGGRIVVVGDSSQSIYAFRGADSASMEKFKLEFNCTVLPLSISWRCPKQVIEEAKKIVPSIEASSTAEDGEVVAIEETEVMDKVSPSDFILCRFNSPLVKIFLKLIKANKPCSILGIDNGQELITLAKKIESTHGTLNNETILKYQTIKDSEYRELKKFYLLEEHHENCEILLAFASIADGIEIYANIRKYLLNSTVKEGILCSTIHKIKGKETDNIFYIEPDKVPRQATLEFELKQEQNLNM